MTTRQSALARDYANIRRNPIPGIEVRAKADNLTTWLVVMDTCLDSLPGDGEPFHRNYVHFEIEFPLMYPREPPNLKCLDVIYHRAVAPMFWWRPHGAPINPDEFLPPTSVCILNTEPAWNSLRDLRAFLQTLRLCVNDRGDLQDAKATVAMLRASPCPDRFPREGRRNRANHAFAVIRTDEPDATRAAQRCSLCTALDSQAKELRRNISGEPDVWSQVRRAASSPYVRVLPPTWQDLYDVSQKRTSSKHNRGETQQVITLPPIRAAATPLRPTRTFGSGPTPAPSRAYRPPSARHGAQRQRCWRSSQQAGSLFTSRLRPQTQYTHNRFYRREVVAANRRSGTTGTTPIFTAAKVVPRTQTIEAFMTKMCVRHGPGMFEFRQGDRTRAAPCQLEGVLRHFHILRMVTDFIGPDPGTIQALACTGKAVQRLLDNTPAFWYHACRLQQPLCPHVEVKDLCLPNVRAWKDVYACMANGADPLPRCSLKGESMHTTVLGWHVEYGGWSDLRVQDCCDLAFGAGATGGISTGSCIPLFLTPEHFQRALPLLHNLGFRHRCCTDPFRVMLDVKPPNEKARRPRQSTRYHGGHERTLMTIAELGKQWREATQHASAIVALQAGVQLHRLVCALFDQDPQARKTFWSWFQPGDGNIINKAGVGRSWLDHFLFAAMAQPDVDVSQCVSTLVPLVARPSKTLLVTAALYATLFRTRKCGSIVPLASVAADTDRLFGHPSNARQRRFTELHKRATQVLNGRNLSERWGFVDECIGAN